MPDSRDNSPEHVAFQLLQMVSIHEGRPLSGPNVSQQQTKKYILDTYAECLLAVNNPGSRARAL